MQSKPVVYIADFIEPDDSLAPELEVLGEIAEVKALGVKGEQNLAGKLDDATCVMVYHFVTLGRETMKQLKQCKLIVRCGAGYDNIDVRAARDMGIAVCNVPDYGTEEVADSAIAMMLVLARGTHLLNSRLRRGRGPWIYSQASPVNRLRGRIFGVIGLGRIGTAAAHRAKAVGMDVMFYDPYVADGWDKATGVKRVESLGELLAASDVLSVHCPANKETIGMIDAQAIGQMKDGAFLVNTARGRIVDTSAIPPAIRAGKLAGAGIDVLAIEPPSDDDALVAAWRDENDPCFDRVVLSPHAAFYSEEGLMDMRVKGSQTCRKAILGQPLRNVVN